MPIVNPDYDPNTGEYVIYGGTNAAMTSDEQAQQQGGNGSGGGGDGSPGPPWTPSYINQNSTNTPHSIFEDYSGPQTDAAKTIIKNYMALLGWPQGIDTEQMALSLLKNNMENKPGDSFDFLWNSSFLTDDMRKANPWARYGMDADSYHQNLHSAQDMIREITGLNVDMVAMGKTDSMQALLQNVLKGGWSQKQIIDAFQSGSFAAVFGGDTKDLKDIVAAQPWLMAGQTYQSQAQQYSTIYGAPPVDTNTLASWYRFNRGAATLGPWYSQKVTEQAAGPKVLTEVR